MRERELLQLIVQKIKRNVATQSVCYFTTFNDSCLVVLDLLLCIARTNVVLGPLNHGIFDANSFTLLTHAVLV